MQRICYIAVAFILCSVVHTEASSLQRRLGQLRDAECSEPGQIVCTDNCSKVSVCLGDGSGSTDGYTTMPVEDCSVGTMCNAASMSCVEPSQSDCHVSDTGFRCHATGYLPDPYNCTVYHLCLWIDEAPFRTGICPAGWAYDPLTTDCWLTHEDRVCTEGPVPACQHIGQNGAVPENPHIYYICTDLDGRVVPILYKCPNGHSWDDGHAECIDSLLIKRN